MNIFYLDSDVNLAAQYHCNRHAVKMCIEQLQLLSTAHRILDGTPRQVLSASGRKSVSYTLNDNRETILYKATHVNHPSAVWVRKSTQHYNWLVQLTDALLSEYTYRYGRVHACTRLMPTVKTPPTNLADNGFVEPPLAMPDHCKLNDAISSYRNYYRLEKRHIAQWKNRPIPSWYE